MHRGISHFKKGYQARTNIVKDEKGYVVTDYHSILAWWRNHFFQLLKVHGVNDVRHMEIHTSEPLVPEPSAFEVEMAIEMIKRHKSPDVDQIPAKLIKAGGRRICSKIHELTNSIWNREELPEEWKKSIIVPIYKGDNTDSSNYRGISTVYKIASNILLSILTPYAKDIIGDHQCGFRCKRSTTDRIFCDKDLIKNGNTMKQHISSL